MKKTYLFITAYLLVTNIFAQSINGKIVDEQMQPIEGAIISLLNSNDKRLSKTSFADENGQFFFEKIPTNTYIISVENIGYQISMSDSFIFEQKNILLPTITLKAIAQSLKEVTVTSKVPFIERKIDKIIVNVEARLDNAGSNALETLEKSPGVLVATDGAIALKGKTGVLIYIDDKPTFLAGEALQNYLRAMPANSIKQIEIITNPSAKYDAAGNAGIINIVTKRNKTMGFFGSFALNINRGIYTRSNNSFNLSYNSKKIGFYALASGGLSNVYQDLYINRAYKSVANSDSAFFNQNSVILNRSTPINAKTGLDFYLNDKTTFGVVAKSSFNFSDKNVDNTAYVADAKQSRVSKVLADNQQDMRFRNVALNFNLRKKINEKGEQMTFDADYVIYKNNNDQVFLNYIFKPINASNPLDDRLDGDLPSDLRIYTLKTDYVKPLNNDATIEMGLKTAYTQTNNAANYFNVINNKSTVNYDLTNQFLYDEYINAAYFNFNKNINRWTLQSGLRYENTIMRGNQLGNIKQSGSKFNNDYNSLFPTFFIQYQLDTAGKHTVGFNYGRRIDRPNFDFLNPFVSPLDKFTFYTGNPFLVPSFSNTFNLTYNIFTLSYARSDDNIFETLEIDKNGKYFSRPNNLNRSESWSFDANLPLAITKKTNGNLYGEIGRQRVISPLYTEQVNWAKNYFLLQGNLQQQLPKNVTLEISGNYQTDMVYGQLLIKGFWIMNLSMQKKILKNKGNIRLNFNDIFWTRRGSGVINNLRQTEADWNSKLDTRTVGITFSYNFGKATKGKDRYKGSGSESEQQRAQK
jgi:Outer membrane protein beta-barrel family/Carboxypeptidase regulatory-like domain